MGGPPPAPMLARLTRELPRGDYLYEPKWDGFRALVARDGDTVEFYSRQGRPMARYFPELVEAFRGLEADRFVVDGEIVVVTPEGFDFGALMLRLHPAASRVARLRAETPASFVAFDLPAAGGADLASVPFAERRHRLERLLAGSGPPLFVTPITSDADTAAEWLRRFTGSGVDGVVAKHRTLGYEPGRRAMLKVKVERTAECVLAGFRYVAYSDVLGSLLLGLHDADGTLRHVGVSTSFTRERRSELLSELRPLAIGLAEHPWRDGFEMGRSPVGRLPGSPGRWEPATMPLDWVPLRPERVVEVAYDTVDVDRFRHPARFVRWRPDRTPESCTFDQLEVAAPRQLSEIVAQAQAASDARS